MEKRRTMFSCGKYGGSASTVIDPPKKTMQDVAWSRPFTQQLDVVILENHPLGETLQALATSYCRRQCKLSEFFEYVRPIVNEGNHIVAFGTAPGTDDVWCLDHTGVVTLAITKETYERLGIVGTKSPWKARPDIHTISFTLHSSELLATLFGSYDAKKQAAIKQWDSRRDPWNIVISSDIPSQLSASDDLEVRKAPQVIQKVHAVRVPRVTPNVLQSLSTETEEEWQEEVAALFEWAGLACLRSQRLQINDQVDPYLAVYDPPLQFDVQNLVHIKWTGLLSRDFVQRVLDTLKSSSFAVVTGQSVASSPVTYIDTLAKEVVRARPRLPAPEGEDTWCLIVTDAEREPSADGRHWILAESIGPCDARWG